ncbi:peptide ABC transporter ATPase [Frankia sp. R43]|uniref:ABC transporter ATP-binding protein n=1 Tax=Frankia sp. R43 TaxID=269536 RepID=UPI0006CA2DD9|nr:ABC transporter ATP-binding protein [Frankia sp. R43]KPM52079.1 peptide ABC transporter ATPase [Frankia sp. R43]
MAPAAQPTVPEAQPLLRVAGLTVDIPTPRGPLRALDDVSLTLAPRQTLGLVGESGSGKSMLVRSIMGIVPPRATVTGTVTFDGVDLNGLPPQAARQYWGRRIAMVFQDPATSLNPVLTIGRQLTEAMRAWKGLRRRQADEHAVELLDQVRIPEPRRRLRQYPHELSGGMRQRVVIAMALACDPELLIADEATTALDVTVQKQILDLLAELQRERGLALVLVSHDLGVVAGRTDRVVVLYGGRIAEEAGTATLFAARRHPYSEALLAAAPRLDSPRGAALRAIAGTPPDLVHPPAGCRFAPRCPSVAADCEQGPPPRRQGLDATHSYACRHPVGALTAVAR